MGNLIRIPNVYRCETLFGEVIYAWNNLIYVQVLLYLSLTTGKLMNIRLFQRKDRPNLTTKFRTTTCTAKTELNRQASFVIAQLTYWLCD